MSLLYRLHFRAQHIGSALVSLVLLVSLSLSTLGMAKVEARQKTPPPPSPTGLSDPREVETFLDGVLSVQLAEDHIPGATVSVVKDGRLLFAKGYGSADLQAGKRVSAQTTLFRIASVSKPFTATAVLQLAEQGKLNLHADVNTYLKTFHLPATYPQPITLAHLLTHTAGFEDRNTGTSARTTRDLEPLGRWLAEHMPARVRPPGELTAYSNYGYALAGYIVEQVSGLPFAQYVEQHLFQPLGMRSSSFRQPVEARLSAALSQGYTYTNGVYRPEPFEALQDAPAGSMSATATDLARFMLAQLQNGRLGNERIFQEATAQGMQRQQFTNDPRMPGVPYGFDGELSMTSQRLLVKAGDTLLFHSLLALLPEQHVGVFVSYNSAGGAAARATFLQAFLDHYYPAPKGATPQPPAGFAQRINQISGTYWPTRRSDTTYEKLTMFYSTVTVTDGGNSRLVISGLGTQPVTFVEVVPWVFHQVDGPQTVVFRTDPTGMIMSMSILPIVTFNKVAWYDAPTFHLALVVACVLLFLSALLLWPLGFVRRAMRRRAPRSPFGQHMDPEGVQAPPPDKQGKPPLQRRASPLLASWLAGVLCVLNVLFVIGLGLIVSNPLNLRYGLTPTLTALFALAFVIATLTVGVVISTILAWWGRFWSTGRRVHYTLVALAALAFAWELVYWNLLGFRT
jgi:CubicO group peptidase (beta-lactamase class C family)